MVLGYCEQVRVDPEIERLEADLHRSRFERWEVETLLADRHRAKIEAMAKPRGKWAARWQLFREITDPVAIYVGWVGALNLLVLWALKAPPFY